MILLIKLLLSIALYSCFAKEQSVVIYHLIDQKNFGETDGSVLQGLFSCPQSSEAKFTCEVVSTDSGLTGKDLMPNLSAKFRARQAANRNRSNTDAITVGLYSIHSWAASTWPHHPDRCALPTFLNMAESEESTGRFKKLFMHSFPGYDGNSTTHPESTVQRSYIREFNGGDLIPIVPFASKLPASAYIASTCHFSGRSRPLREILVSRLEKLSRVDSLGKCHRNEATTGHAGTPVLRSGKNEAETLKLKQDVLSRYLFYFAFENTIESGYVTEKVFDALKAGAVPVYLGDPVTCRRMMPDPRAAIYADDFLVQGMDSDSLENMNVDSLAAYLNYLIANETAYAEHLNWRERFDPARLDPMLRVSWPCRICKWATRAARDASKQAEFKKAQMQCQKL